MKVIRTGTKHSIYDDSIVTYDRLPVGTYAIGYSKMEGCYLLSRQDIQVYEKIYGAQEKKVGKVLSSFERSERNLGVILSGDKGIGKTMFAKLLCMSAIKKGYPVIIVDACYPGISRFIESIDQECVVLFDEFDKMFRYSEDDDVDNQANLLSLFDGIAGGKKLFIVTCNELYRLNSYIVNRPGRFHYHLRFGYPTPENVRDYLQDKLDGKYPAEIERAVDFSRKISLNYDCLRAIAFEIGEGSSFADAISDLNILTTEEDEYVIRLHFKDGRILNQFRYKTNLFEYDYTMDSVRFYDPDGHYIMDAYFEKEKVMYDISRNTLVIPQEGVKIVEDEINESYRQDYRDAEPTYMEFIKKNMRNMHYMI